jgi:hypothetical protein
LVLSLAEYVYDADGSYYVAKNQDKNPNERLAIFSGPVKQGDYYIFTVKESNHSESSFKNLSQIRLSI